MYPYISIIVPVYKVGDYIKYTVQSIINQDYRNFELVLVDDGSPDDSAAIAESLLKESSVEYSIIHTENRGVSAARNTGMEYAKGRYVIMVDADDVLTPDFLGKYVSLIKKYPNINIYSTSFTIFKGDWVIEQPKLSMPVMEYEAEVAQIAFYNRNPRFLLPTLMYSKGFLDKYAIRFDESVRFSEDVQFIWRSLALNTSSVVHSSFSGYHYILHEGSTMTASGIQKIMTGCKGVVKLDEDIHESLTSSIKDTFVPMWFFSMLHSSAKMLPYSLFKDLYRQSESKPHMKMLRKHSSGKVKWVAAIMHLAPCLGYKIMKKY
jgi:glycosyltransferase involved in cell wall biosynthesis